MQNFRYFYYNRAEFSVERKTSVRYTVNDAFVILTQGKWQIRTNYEWRENN